MALSHLTEKPMLNMLKQMTLTGLMAGLLTGLTA